MALIWPYQLYTVINAYLPDKPIDSVMKEGTKTKVYAATVTILLLTALTGAGVLYDVKGDLQAGLNQEMLNSEKLLSQKLLLDKEIANLKQELLALSGNNSELNSQLNMASSKVQQLEITANKLQKENNNFKAIKKEVDGLKKLRDHLQVEVAGLKEANKKLMDSQGQMEKTIAELEAENDALKDKLKAAAVLKAGNFRIDVLRKNADKLTVKARQTKVVSVSFDLPKAAMASIGKNKLYLVITAPNGKELVEDAATKKVIFPEGIKTEINPTVTQDIDLGKGPQRLTISYPAKDDLEKGVYKVALYTDDLFLGGSQFRLMK